MKLDAAGLGTELATIVKAAVAIELAPLREEIAILKARPDLREDITQLRERAARLEERKPEKGEAGQDGLGIDDLDCCVLDDDRTIELAFRNGDTEKVFTLKWPTLIDRGVYRAGEPYAHGDVVTFGGSMWIAQKDTEAKPGEGDDWRLAVKKGRDGKGAK